MRIIPKFALYLDITEQKYYKFTVIIPCIDGGGIHFWKKIVFSDELHPFTEPTDSSFY